MDPALLDDPIEIGRRIRAAIGYAKGRRSQAKIAAEIGVSAPTLLKYTKGDLGAFSKSAALREQLIRKVADATSYPEGFGISGPPEVMPGEWLDRLTAVEASLVDRNETGAKLAKSLASLTSKVDGVQNGQADLLRRLERLERGQATSRS